MSASLDTTLKVLRRDDRHAVSDAGRALQNMSNALRVSGRTGAVLGRTGQALQVWDVAAANAWRRWKGHSNIRQRGCVSGWAHCR